MADVRVKYVADNGPWSEASITGKQQSWRKNDVSFVPSLDASMLLASGRFVLASSIADYELGAIESHMAQHSAIGDNIVNLPNDVVLSDSTYSKWSMPLGNGDASMSPATIPGYAARVKTNGAAASLGYALARRAIEPISFSSDDVIQFYVYCDHGNNSRRIRFTFATDAAYANKLMFDGFIGCMKPGHNLISCKLAAGTYGGTGVSTDVWKYLEISLTGPTYQTALWFEVGPIYVGKAPAVPAVIVTFDAAHKQLYTWALPTMKVLSIPGNVYVAGYLSLTNQANYCTPAELLEMRAAGWGMGCYGYVGSKNANGHSATSVTAAQSVGAGGSFTINGTMASGGVATLDKPRPLALICSGDESANSFTVTGTATDGSALTEKLTGNTAASFKPFSKNRFATVTGIVAQNATAANVSVGTGWQGEETAADVQNNIDFLAAYGLSGDPLNYAYPLGEFNHESETWLRSKGFVAARTTFAGTSIMLNQLRRNGRANRYMSPCAVTLGDTGGYAAFKTQLDNAISRGHDMYVLGHLDAASATDRIDLDKGLAYLSMLARQGSIRLETFASYEALLAVS